jgi:hypothetical protein
MRTTRRAFSGAIGAALFAPALTQLAWAEPGYLLVPVVARGSSTQNIALATLRRIFLGETVEAADGQRYVPFNHPPDTRARSLFDQVVLNMSPSEVGQYWVDQRIRSGARPPRVVPNVLLLRQVVARLPGAISYLTLDAVDGSVRALSIDGVAPEAVAYALREKASSP